MTSRHPVTLFITLVVGIMLGSAAGFLVRGNSSRTGKLTAAERALLARTEEYQPSCAELKDRSHPSLHQQGTDYYLTLTRPSYYYVIGITMPPDQPPVFAWWGADLDSKLTQCR